MKLSYQPKSIFASLPRTARGVPIVLGGDPKGKNFLYTNGNSVIIRDIENPAVCEVYTEHSVPTTVAKYSPSGFYIASGDVSGKVRIWDTTQKEHVLKAEYQHIAGAIKDIAWSPDSQRMAIGGEGRERFGHVFLVDTGSSVGEIVGHSKCINSLDYRPERPFRIITASEDMQVNFYEGPPFKFGRSQQEHQRFPNVARFSKNGQMAASGGADGKVIVYEGKTGEISFELQSGDDGENAHKGGVYGLSFSPTGNQLLTCSADKTAKLWDIDQKKVISEFKLGDEIEDQQVSCLWQGNHMLSVSLSGFINYLDVNNPERPLKVIKGHNKSITAMALSEDKSTIFTGSHDGNIIYWDVGTGASENMMGKSHSNQVQEISVAGEDLVTCSMDDTVRYSNAKSKTFGQLDVKMKSMPKGVKAQRDKLVVCACLNEVMLLINARVAFTLPVTYEASCVAIHPNMKEVAVGGTQDNKVHVYTLTNDTLVEKTTLEQGGAITDVEYSPDGSLLAAADANRRIVSYKVPEYEKSHKYDWGFHSARVNCLAWSPDCLHLASGGVDCNIFIWSTQTPTKTIEMRGAHPMAQITRLCWTGDNTLLSSGQDCCIRHWEISF